jgi:hypothetical protein
MLELREQKGRNQKKGIENRMNGQEKKAGKEKKTARRQKSTDDAFIAPFLFAPLGRREDGANRLVEDVLESHLSESRALEIPDVPPDCDQNEEG